MPLLLVAVSLHVMFNSALVQKRCLSWYSVNLILSLDVPISLSPLFQGPPGRPGFPVTVFSHFVCIHA